MIGTAPRNGKRSDLWNEGKSGSLGSPICCMGLRMDDPRDSQIKKGHTLADHQLGADLAHTHDGDADHDHDEIGRAHV